MKKDFSTIRLRGMPTSIFSTMSKMASDYNAVNLGQGFPDFDGPAWIMKEAYQAMIDGKNQYAPSPGIFSLRKIVSEIQTKYYGIEYDPDTEITVTAGATEALYSTINAFVNPGDEVIMFEPYYDAHQADVILAGGVPVYVTLRKPDFSFDMDELIESISSKTKMIIVNTPHNPTGKVFSREELNFIAIIAIENDLIVISDEVYEFLLFNEAIHLPIAAIDGMRDRTITISSTGKTFGLTGWKIGFATASKKLTDSIRKIHQWTTFAVNTPGQNAMAHAFKNIEGYLPDFRKEYLTKRDLVLSGLEGSTFKTIKPQGSYFIMAEFPEGKWIDDIDAAKDIVINHGVATIPPSVFYSKSDEGKTMLRICFAKKNETLEKGINILRKI